MKVSSRLAWSFGTLIGMLVVIVVIALWRLSGVNESLDRVVNDRAPKLEALESLAYRAMDNARIVRNIILLKDEKALATNKEAFDKNAAVNAEQINFLAGNASSAEDQALLKDIQDSREAYRAYTSDVIALALANKNDEATSLLYGEKYKTQAAFFAAIRKMGESEKTQMHAAAADATASYSSARAVIIGLGGLACLIGVALAIVITRGLIGQLGGEPAYATSVARRIAAGDLAVAVQTLSNDDRSLLSAMKTMQDSLATVVSNVRQGSESVATASAQIAQGNQDLSSRTEQQASALQETAASMDQLSSTVKQNADNAHQANQLALGASTVAIKGGEVVSQVVETMKGINDSSKKIADIIGVIDGIALQTNILALNAAVEAARAGEQGRGFAVVASEVRNLAGRSAEAAREIKSLIGASVERVEHGTVLADQAGATMMEVVSSIKRVTDIMGEISAASGEQSAGVAQVGKAVSQMDQTTQQNAALVEESAAAAESLMQQAQVLVQTVGVFKLDDGAGQNTASSRRQAG